MATHNHPAARASPTRHLHARPDARERGAAATVSIVLITPVLVFVCLAAFQTALWNHDRALARASARTVAAAIARNTTPVDAARTDAVAVLTANTTLTDVVVRIDTGGGQVTVTITGQAPGILIGTHAPITVTVALPTEGWTPL